MEGQGAVPMAEVGAALVEGAMAPQGSLALAEVRLGCHTQKN